MNTNDKKSDFHELQELIETSPDADLHSINEWFAIGKECRIDIHSLLDCAHAWSEQKDRDPAARAVLSGLVLELSPERKFEKETQELENRLIHSRVKNAELSVWVEAAHRLRKVPTVIIDQVRKWLSMSLPPQNEEVLVQLLHEFDFVAKGSGPQRSEFSKRGKTHKLKPKTGTTAKSFSGDPDKKEDGQGFRRDHAVAS